MKLTEKELRRASSDGYAIVSRPDRAQGGYWVLAVRVADGKIVGWPHHVDSRLDIASAVKETCRDLDKFLGVGAEMSDAGRMRVRSAI